MHEQNVVLCESILSILGIVLDSQDQQRSRPRSIPHEHAKTTVTNFAGYRVLGIPIHTTLTMNATSFCFAYSWINTNQTKLQR